MVKDEYAWSKEESEEIYKQVREAQLLLRAGLCPNCKVRLEWKKDLKVCPKCGFTLAGETKPWRKLLPFVIIAISLIILAVMKLIQLLITLGAI